MTHAPQDEAFMQEALRAAQSQQGRTAPNPAVGCILVRDGSVLARGATGDGGRPHAEEIALKAAGEAARGATAFVTLEPCGSRSSGGAGCAQLLIEAGVSRVVCAVADPHPHGAGGFARLEAAGVALTVGPGEEAATALYAAFFHRVETGQATAFVSDTPESFEAELRFFPSETLETALKRLGAAGFSRVYAAPHTAEAEAIKAAPPPRS